MSILPAIARLLVAEHNRRPITGDALLIGRQTVAFDPSMTDVEFFKSIAPDIRSVRALDVSGYEGADIIHDLNDELPVTLHNIADFIFDGSCLDNLFDPANAMRSFSRMLRPGGRLFCFEHGTPIQSAFVCFSPEWFRGFFTANAWPDFSVTAQSFDNIMDETWVPGPPCGRDFVTVALGTKGFASTDHKSPIQEQYRKLHEAA